MARRALTDGESAILLIIQEGYGQHNSVDRVYFSHADEAVMFCKLANGMNAAYVNLSNLATQRADGTIASDEELRVKWLRLRK
jgi:hypothetical protein